MNAEERGSILSKLDAAMPQFCAALIEPLVELVYAMNVFDDRDLSDLALLTLGPTLQGGRNNLIGSRASRAVFESIQTLIPDDWRTFVSERFMRFQTPSGQDFVLTEGSDPDVRLDLTTASGEEIPVVVIEIKGGEDASNAHNRAGEAEKSHIKAKAIAGYRHRWTIMMMQGLDRNQLRGETPSSTKLFEASDIMGQVGADWDDFGRIFAAVLDEPFS